MKKFLPLSVFLFYFTINYTHTATISSTPQAFTSDSDSFNLNFDRIFFDKSLQQSPSLNTYVADSEALHFIGRYAKNDFTYQYFRYYMNAADKFDKPHTIIMDYFTQTDDSLVIINGMSDFPNPGNTPRLHGVVATNKLATKMGYVQLIDYKIKKMGPTDLWEFSTPYQKVVDIKYDSVNTQVLVMAEVKQSSYGSGSPFEIYEYEYTQTDSNINIGIAAFDATYGYLKWQQLIGCKDGNDQYRGMEIFGSHAYVALNCIGRGFSFDHINLFNGQLLKKHTYYTVPPTLDNQILGINQTPNGNLQALAYVNAEVVDSVGGNTFTVTAPSRVLMYISTDDFSIKSAIATAVGTTDDEISIGKQPVIIYSYIPDSVTIKNFIVRHGINGSKTGLYFGYYDSNLLGTTTGCTSADCHVCTPSTLSYCYICKDTKFLFNGVCQSTAASFTKSYNPASTTKMMPCYYSCDTCTGPSRIECLTCKSGSSLTFATDTCSCAANFENYQQAEICVTDCSSTFGATSNNQCLIQCPDNTYADFLDYASGNFSAPSTITVNGGKCLQVNKASDAPISLQSAKFATLPTSITANVWLRVTAKDASTAVYLNAYNVMKLYEASNGHVKFSYTTTSQTVEVTITTSTLVNAGWSFVSVMKRERSTTQLELDSGYCTSCTATINQGGTSTPTVTSINTSPNSNIIIGGNSNSGLALFSGQVSHLRVFSKYHAKSYVEKYFKYRTQAGVPDLMASWGFTQDLTTNKFYDNSPSSKEYDYGTNSGTKATCQAGLAISQSLKRQAVCKGFKQVTTNLSDNTRSHHAQFSLDPAKYQTTNYLLLVNETTLTINADDRLDVYPTQDRCNSKNSTPIVQYKWQSGILKPNDPLVTFTNTLQTGSYYTLCVRITPDQYGGGNPYATPYIGQIYIAHVPYLYLPSDYYTQQGMNTRFSYTAFGGDTTYGDKVYFIEYCHLSIAPDSPPADNVALTRNESTGNFNRKNIDDFRYTGKRMEQCFTPSYQKREFKRIGNMYWLFSKTPYLDNVVSEVQYNSEFYEIKLTGVSKSDYDRVGVMIYSATYTSCNVDRLLPLKYYGEYQKFGIYPLIWIGKSTGFYFQEASATQVELLLCYRPSTVNQAPPWWTLHTSGSSYKLVVKGIQTNKNLPEISAFFPERNSAITDTQTRITWTFNGQLKASKPPSTNGLVKVYQASVHQRSHFILTATSVWQQLITSDTNSASVGNLLYSQYSDRTVFTLQTTNSNTDPGYLQKEKGYFVCTVAKSFKTTSGQYFAGALTHTDEFCPHFFFVSDATITPSTSLIPPTSKTLTITGTNLKTSLSNLHQTQRILVSFDVLKDDLITKEDCDNDPLHYPIGYFDSINETQIKITDTLNLNGCTSGNLVANITIVRQSKVSPGNYVYNIHFLNQQVAKIGCDPGCFSCTGPTTSDCVMCPNGTGYNNDGTCKTSCEDPVKPFKLTKTDLNALNAPKTFDCIASCPDNYKSDSRTNQCIECSQNCKGCTSFVPNSCVACQPGFFFFQGACIPNCPIPVYSNSFETYTCSRDSVKYPSPIVVKILQPIFESKQPKNKQIYFQAMVESGRVGAIASVQWEQISPKYDTSITSNKVIDLPTDASLIDMIAKANMNTFNSYSQTQPYAVKIIVTDSVGNKGVDVKQFFMNEPPKTEIVVIAPDTSVTPLSVGNSNQKFTFTLGNWYNYIDDHTFDLKIAIYYKLINKNVYYLLRPYKAEKVYSLEMPYVYFTKEGTLTGGGTSTKFQMQFFITAVDTYGARTTQTVRVDVSNNYDYSQLDATLTYLSSKNLTDINQLLITLDSCEAILQKQTSNTQTNSSLLRRASFIYMPCATSFHCRQGTCDIAGGGYCKCLQGYGGQTCDWKTTQITHLSSYSAATATYLKANYNLAGMQANNADSYVGAPDIELISALIKSAMKIPELVSQADLITFIDFLTEIIKQGKTQLTIPTVGAMQYQDLQRITQAISRCMEGIFTRMRHYRIQSAKAIGTPNETAAVTEEATKKTYLSGKMNSLIDSLQVALKLFGRILTTQEPNIKLTTEIFSYQVTKAKSGDISGTRKVLFDGKVAQFNIPSNIFSSSTSLPDPKQSVIEIIIHWITNPMQLNQYSDNELLTSLSEYSLFDVDGTKIEFNAVNTPIDIKLPYPITPVSFEKQNARCKWYNSSFKDPITNIVTPQFDTTGCATLAVDGTQIICRCSHLSKFGGVQEHSTFSLARSFSRGVYTDYNGFSYWYKSLGLYTAAVVIGIYLILFPIFYFGERVKLNMLRRQIQRELDQLNHKAPFTDAPDKDYRSVAIMDHNRAKGVNVGASTSGKIGLRDSIDDFGIKKGKNVKDKPKRSTTLLGEFDEQKTQRKKKQKDKTTRSKNDKYMMQEDRGYNSSKVKQTPRVTPNLNKQIQELKQSAKHAKNRSFQEQEQSDHYDFTQKKSKKGKKNDSAFGRLKKGSKDSEKMMQFSKNKINIIDDSFSKHNNSMSKISPMGGISDYPCQIDSQQRDGGIKDQIQALEMQREKKRFTFWEQLRGSSPILNTLIVTNLLLPRHVRFTLLFSQVNLNMFACAVYYNNARNPLEIPEDSITITGLVFEMLFVSLLAPLGADIAVYFMVGLFRVSEGRFRNVENSEDYQTMIYELRKEIFLRYVMAYFVFGAGSAAMMWYIIKVSSIFGWHVSSGWFWSSFWAWMFDFVIYELIWVIFMILLYKCKRKAALCLDKFRQFRQAQPEQ